MMECVYFVIVVLVIVQFEYCYVNGSVLYFMLYFMFEDEMCMCLFVMLYVENCWVLVWVVCWFVWLFLYCVVEQDCCIVEVQVVNSVCFGWQDGIFIEFDFVWLMLDVVWMLGCNFVEVSEWVMQMWLQCIVVLY